MCVGLWIASLFVMVHWYLLVKVTQEFCQWIMVVSWNKYTDICLWRQLKNFASKSWWYLETSTLMFACEDNSRTLPVNHWRYLETRTKWHIDVCLWRQLKTRTLPVNHGGILKQVPNGTLIFACEDNSRTLPVNHGGILKQVYQCLLVKTTQELCQWIMVVSWNKYIDVCLWRQLKNFASESLWYLETSTLIFACEDNSRILPVNHGGILKQVHLMFACEDNSRTLPVNMVVSWNKYTNVCLWRQLKIFASEYWWYLETSTLMFACEDNSRILPVNYGGILKQVHWYWLVKTTQEFCQWIIVVSGNKYTDVCLWRQLKNLCQWIMVVSWNKYIDVCLWRQLKNFASTIMVVSWNKYIDVCLWRQFKNFASKYGGILKQVHRC